MADDKKQQKEKGKDAKEAKPPEGDAEASAAAPASKSKKTLFIVIIAIAMGIALLVVVGVVVSMRSKSQAAAAEHELSPEAAAQGTVVQPKLEGSGEEDEVVEGEEPMGAILPLDTFVVNLSSGKYLRIQIQFEFNGRDIPKRMYAKLVPLRDAIITDLSSKSADDLGVGKGREGLRNELRDTVNEMLGKEEVKKVYFTQFVIQ